MHYVIGNIRAISEHLLYTHIKEQIEDLSKIKNNRMLLGAKPNKNE